MRRLTALLLFAATLLPHAVLLASSNDPEVNLPACCRHNGKHHCYMTAGQIAAVQRMLARGRQLNAQHVRCPLYPRAVTAAARCTAVAGRTDGFTAGLAAAAVARVTAEARTRDLSFLACGVRGPPAGAV